MLKQFTLVIVTEHDSGHLSLNITSMLSWSRFIVLTTPHLYSCIFQAVSSILSLCVFNGLFHVKHGTRSFTVVCARFSFQRKQKNLSTVAVDAKRPIYVSELQASILGRLKTSTEERIWSIKKTFCWRTESWVSKKHATVFIIFMVSLEGIEPPSIA